ncbi:ABC transporter permease [Streptomyces vinaceus]|uniref:ABC transporter permease n=1 Tax=Streptomyces vinaceus TaxID=1960 RepID=UPI0036C3125E
MFRTALRNVLAHKARLLMTVLAVVLGVAFVSGTLVFSASIQEAMGANSTRSYQDVAAVATARPPHGADPEIGPDGLRVKPSIPQKTVDSLRSLPGVTGVSGQVSGFAGVGDKQHGRLLGQLWANRGSNFMPGPDGNDPRYHFVSGKPPLDSTQIALDKRTAAKGGYRVGDRVKVGDNGSVTENTLAGIFSTDDPKVVAGASLVLFDNATAQNRYRMPGAYEVVTVRAHRADPALLSKVNEMLGEQGIVESGAVKAAAEAKDIERQTMSTNKMLLAFAGIALFVGIFLIYNTFTMLIAQRTKELALLRAIGATRRQVMNSVLAEALIVGLFSSVLGLALGVAMAAPLPGLLDSMDMGVPVAEVVVPLSAVVSSFVVGSVVTLLSAWVPARLTGKISPVAALGSAHLPSSAKSLLVRNLIGVLVATGGLAMALVGRTTEGNGGLMAMGFGSVFLGLGIIALLPLISPRVILVVRPFLTRLFGSSGKLATSNAVRNPRRTAVTAACLAIGLTMVTTLSVLGVSLGQAVGKAGTSNLKADYRVAAMATGMGLDPSVVGKIKASPAVTAMSPLVSERFADSHGSYTSVSGVDTSVIDKLIRVNMVKGTLTGLREGQVSVSEQVAADQGLAVGSTLEVSGGYAPGGARKQAMTVTVGAIHKETGKTLLGIITDVKTVAKVAGEKKPYIKAVWVATKGGGSKANEQALRDALDRNPALAISTQGDLRNETAGIINTMLNIMYGLLGMALIISVLGVVNTLAMSVFERTQEIGMLRAIGLDRSRVKNMIRLEAVVISLFGAVLGITTGVFAAWVLGVRVAKGVTFYELVMPWDRLGLFLLLAVVVGVLASTWPARSAAKLSMLTAIKTD